MLRAADVTLEAGQAWIPTGGGAGRMLLEVGANSVVFAFEGALFDDPNLYEVVTIRAFQGWIKRKRATIAPEPQP